MMEVIKNKTKEQHQQYSDKQLVVQQGIASPDAKRW